MNWNWKANATKSPTNRKSKLSKLIYILFVINCLKVYSILIIPQPKVSKVLDLSYDLARSYLQWRPWQDLAKTLVGLLRFNYVIKFNTVQRSWGFREIRYFQWCAGYLSDYLRIVTVTWVNVVSLVVHAFVARGERSVKCLIILTLGKSFAVSLG